MNFPYSAHPMFTNTSNDQTSKKKTIYEKQSNQLIDQVRYFETLYSKSLTDFLRSEMYVQLSDFALVIL